MASPNLDLKNYIPSRPKKMRQNRYMVGRIPCVECTHKRQQPVYYGQMAIVSKCDNCGGAICWNHGTGLRTQQGYICSKCRERQQPFLQNTQSPSIQQAAIIVDNIRIASTLLTSENKDEAENLIADIFRMLV